MHHHRILLPLLLLLSFTAFAQTAHFIPRQELEGRELGWMAPYPPERARAPIKVDNRVYSPAQLSLADHFARWMQASYMPTGGLGEVRAIVSDPLGLYGQSDAARPQTYGALVKTYIELKYDSSRKMIPATNGHLRWAIVANAVEFGEPLQVLNTPADFYFLLPLFGESVTGSNEHGEIRTRREYDLSGHAAVKPYVTYFNFQLYSSQYESSSNVLLSRDNRLPFVKITRAEYLDKMEQAVERRYVQEKASAVKDWAAGPVRTKALLGVDGRHQKRLAVLRDALVTGKDRLQEPAEVSSLQPGVLLENSPDLFAGTDAGARRFPVYKVDPQMAALAKTDQPQWIVVTWDGNIQDPTARHLRDSILGNFDFAYLHDFVFDPEKVKGRPYTPRRSPTARETVVAAKASAAASRSASDPGVHFFEDFSTTPSGQKPIGWSAGVDGLVTSLTGLPGHWAVMAGANIVLRPSGLTTPLPQDFTVSYDLVAAEKFTWGAKGLTFELAGGKAVSRPEWYIRLRLRPGYDGRDGEAVIETKVPSGYPSGTKWAVATGFSNNKTHNRVTVSVTKTGESIRVQLDGQTIAEYEKAVPAGLLFNALSFLVGGNYGEHDKFYISNIAVRKP